MNSTQIQALKNIRPRQIKNIGAQLLTTTRYPILYQRITKCGSTFLRSLMWLLENDTLPTVNLGKVRPPFPELTAAHLSNRQVREATHKFVVARHPVSRFMSLYYDKILGGSKPMGLFNDYVGIDHQAGENVKSHRLNCDKALDFISRQLTTLPMKKINWHWKPQHIRLAQVQPYGFTVLQLENIGTQLPSYLVDLVPDIKTRMQMVSIINRSPKPLPASEILTAEHIERIQDIYRTDMLVWQEVDDFWRGEK